MKAVSMYIPAGLQDSEQQIHKVRRVFAQMFGGCTTHAAQGSWLNQHQVLVEEPVTIVQSYETVPGVVDRNLLAIRKLALEVKEALHQEAVLFTITKSRAILI